MTTASGSAPTVRCPTCGGPARYASDNPWRPFCTEHCRSVDLGAWASERYRVAAQPTDEGDGDMAPPPTND